MTDTPPVLHLELRVPVALRRALTDEVWGRVHDTVTATLADLGLQTPFDLTVIPHSPEPDLEPAAGSQAAPSLWADGHQRCLRDGDLERIVAYARGSESILPVTAENQAELWRDLEDAGPAAVGDALALLCRSVVGRQLFRGRTERKQPFEVAIHPDYLRGLSLADDAAEKFSLMWEGLGAELGLPPVPTRLRLDSSLRPRGFQFWTAGLTDVPWVGLEPGQVLVNDTQERLALLKIESVPSVKPGTLQPAAIVASESTEILEAVGLTTWDPSGYLILACSSAIRENAWRFMTPAVSDQMLDQLAQAFPEVVSAARDLLPPDTLTEVLQELLLDQVSVRDLRGICEALVRGRSDARESQLDPVTLARHRQRYGIAHKVARGTGTVVVYLLDPALEARDLTDPLVAAAVRSAVARELGFLPPTAQRPAVLTMDSTRAEVRDALRPQFPALPVVGYGDIPPEWNVQPVARITAN